jgi:hypothetical protein
MEMETNTLREDIRTLVGKVESLVFLISTYVFSSIYGIVLENKDPVL